MASTEEEISRAIGGPRRRWPFAAFFASLLGGDGEVEGLLGLLLLTHDIRQLAVLATGGSLLSHGVLTRAGAPALLVQAREGAPGQPANWALGVRSLKLGTVR